MPGSYRRLRAPALRGNVDRDRPRGRLWRPRSTQDGAGQPSRSPGYELPAARFGRPGRPDRFAGQHARCYQQDLLYPRRERCYNLLRDGQTVKPP